MLLIKNVSISSMLHDELIIKNVPYISINIDSLNSYLKLRKDDIAWTNNLRLFNQLSNIHVDIYDTCTGVTKEYLSLDKISSNLNDIFGVVTVINDVVFIGVSFKLWNFLDICNDIKQIDYTSLPELVKRNGVSSSNFGYVLVNELNMITVTTLYSPIDKNCIFWKSSLSHNEYITILDLYMNIFNEIGQYINKDLSMYLFCLSNNTFYKLDTNKDIIRFITKIKVLSC